MDQGLRGAHSKRSTHFSFDLIFTARPSAYTSYLGGSAYSNLHRNLQTFRSPDDSAAKFFQKWSCKYCLLLNARQRHCLSAAIGLCSIVRSKMDEFAAKLQNYTVAVAVGSIGGFPCHVTPRPRHRHTILLKNTKQSSVEHQVGANVIVRRDDVGVPQ